jgi:hypothetical protein
VTIVVKIRFPQTEYKSTINGTVATANAEQNPTAFKYYTKADGRVFLHPMSIMFKHPPASQDTPLIIFHTKVRTSKVFLRDATTIGVLPALLFGAATGPVIIHHEHGEIRSGDGFIVAKAWSKVAVLINGIKKEMEILFQAKINDPSLKIWEADIVRVIDILINDIYF